MGNEAGAVETREVIGKDVPEDGLQALIAKRAANGVKCRIVEENGQRVLVCVSPPL
jgi:hypothetical protein